LIKNREKSGIPILIDLLSNPKYFQSAKIDLENITRQRFGDLPPIISKKMLEEYIKKWKTWWEENKDTFKFPEEKE